MRGGSSFLNRLLQFAVLAVLGALLFFASAQAFTQSDERQRFLAALQTGDRAALIRLLDDQVRVTAEGPGGEARTLEGRASALGYLEGWRSGAGGRLGASPADEGMEIGSLTIGGAAVPAVPGARLRISFSGGRVVGIEHVAPPVPARTGDGVGLSGR